MIKGLFTGLAMLLCAQMFAQDVPKYNTQVNIYYRFIYFPRTYDATPLFLNQWDHTGLPQAPDTKLKRDYLYQYLHNGDNIKMAQDFFTNDIRKSWFRNFDAGEFAKITFQLTPDYKTHPNAPVQCSGTLGFFKLFHHRPIGKLRRRLIKD